MAEPGGDLILVDRPHTEVAVVTLDRPDRPGRLPRSSP